MGAKPKSSKLREALAGNRLVTLIGAGGVGKTRLAVQVAAEVAGEFGDGVCYVDLAPITAAEVVPVTVARALGLPDQPGRSTMDTLLRLVRGRHMLVVLDNCEHLLDAVRQPCSVSCWAARRELPCWQLAANPSMSRAK